MGKLVDEGLLESYFCDAGKVTGEFVTKLYDYFCVRVSERLVLARAQLYLGELEIVRDHLHVLKNAFLNVGAREVANECQKLEDRVGELSEGQFLDSLQFLSDRADVVKVELKEIIRQRS